MPPNQPEQQLPKQPEIRNETAALMISVAVFYDALQALLTPVFLGWLVTPPAFLTFYIWFKMKGINFASAKRVSIMGGGFIFELIPMLNALPAWTLAVSLIILDTKIKKKGGI